MIGNDIIAEARKNFGETAAATVTAPDMEKWLNTALRELYSLLPIAELETLAQTTSVALTDGKGILPAGLDHLLSAAVAGVPAQPIPLEGIQVIDANPFMRPTLLAVFAVDGESVWARNAEGNPATILLTHIDPPDAITDFGQEVVLPKWHAALVLFTTAFAYAQEEDKGQAQHYRNEALALINRTFTAPEQEGLEQ